MSLDATVVGYNGTKTLDDGTEVDEIVIQVQKQDVPYNYMPAEERVVIAHDYVRFFGHIGIQQQNDGHGKYPVPSTRGAVNWVDSYGSVTIGIRDMIDVVLPLLVEHKYLQPEHLKGSEGEDIYMYTAGVIHYRKDDRSMVAFRRTGQSHWEHVSLSLWNDIKDGLQLSLTKKEIANREEKLAQKAKQTES